MSGSFAMVPAEVLATGNGYAIAVYAAIAQHASKTGEAFPSVSRIQEITGWSRPTVDKAIRVLCDAGVLVKTNRANNGMKRSNAYSLLLDSRTPKTANVQTEATLPTMVTTLPLVGNDVTVGTKRGYHEQEVLEPEEIEPEAPQPPTVEDGFEAFWSVYPKKVGKKAVQSWWDRKKPSPDLQAEMLSAIEWQANSPGWRKDNGQFIPNPMTWLNRGSWEDERPAAPEGTETVGGWTVLTGGANDAYAGTYNPLRTMTPEAKRAFDRELEQRKREQDAQWDELIAIQERGA